MDFTVTQRAELSGVILITASELVREHLGDIVHKIRIVCPRLPEHFNDAHLGDLVETCVRRMSHLSDLVEPLAPEHDTRVVCSVVHGAIGVLLASQEEGIVRRLRFLYSEILPNEDFDELAKEEIDAAMERMYMPGLGHVHMDTSQLRFRSRSGHSPQLSSDEYASTVLLQQSVTTGSDSPALQPSQDEPDEPLTQPIHVLNAHHQPHKQAPTSNGSILKDKCRFAIDLSPQVSTKSDLGGSQQILDHCLLVFDGKTVSQYEIGQSQGLHTLTTYSDEQSSYYCRPTTHPCGAESNPLVYLSSDNDNLHRLAVYDTKARNIHLTPRFGNIIELHSTQAFEDGVHAFGMDEFSRVTHEVLRTGADEWEELSPRNDDLPVQALNEGAVTVLLGECLFFMGGISHGLDRMDVLAYNFVSNNWHRCRPLPRGLSHHAAARAPESMPDCIFISGGWHSGHLSDRSRRYDAHSDVWVDAGRMRASRRDHSLLVDDPHGLLAIGGLTNNFAPRRAIERYDVVTEKWTTVEKGDAMQAWYAGVVMI